MLVIKKIKFKKFKVGELLSNPDITCTVTQLVMLLISVWHKNSSSLKIGVLSIFVYFIWHGNG